MKSKFLNSPVDLECTGFLEETVCMECTDAIELPFIYYFFEPLLHAYQWISTKHVLVVQSTIFSSK